MARDEGNGWKEGLIGILAGRGGMGGKISENDTSQVPPNISKPRGTPATHPSPTRAALHFPFRDGLASSSWLVKISSLCSLVPTHTQNVLHAPARMFERFVAWPSHQPATSLSRSR